MSDESYKEYVRVIHIHPDPSVKPIRRKYAYTCLKNCTNTSAGKTVVAGFMRPWTVGGFLPAFPVLLNGSIVVDPFRGLPTVSIEGACGGGQVFVVNYDYVKANYRIYVNTPTIVGRNGIEYPMTIRSGVVRFKGEPLDTSFGSYAGTSDLVPYRKSTGSVCIAVDPRALPNYKGQLFYKIRSNSSIMIGQQTQESGTMSITRKYVSGIDDQGQIVYKNYSFGGPCGGFSNVVSDIEISPKAIPLGRYIGPTFGTVVITTSYGGDYIDGVTILSLTNGEADAMIGQTKCSVLLSTGVHSFIAYKKVVGLLLIGNGQVTVEKDKTVNLDISLEQTFYSNHKVVPVIDAEVELEDGTISQEKIEYTGPYNVSYGAFDESELKVMIRDMMGSMTTVFTECIGMYISAMLATRTGAGNLYGGNVVRYNVVGGVRGLVMIPFKQVVRVSVTTGQGKMLIPATSSVVTTAITVLTTNSLTGTLRAGEGVNEHMVDVELRNDSPETEEGQEPIPSSDDTPAANPGSTFDPYGTNNPRPDSGPHSAPVAPASKCIHPIIPGEGELYEEEPVEEGGSVEEDEETESKAAIYNYIVVSMASIVGTVNPIVAGLYVLSGVVSGVRGSTSKVGYSSNMITVDGHVYEASEPTGVSCLTVAGIAVDGGATIDRSNNVVMIPIGVAPVGSKYIIHGEWVDHTPEELKGKLTVMVKPSDAESTVSVSGGGEVLQVGSGPTYVTKLYPGTYTIGVSAEGYHSQGGIPVTIVKDGDSRIEVELIPIVRSKKIRFNITCRVPNSTLYINGIRYNAKPPTSVTMTVSTYVSFTFKCDATVSGIRFVGSISWAGSPNSNSEQNIFVSQYPVMDTIEVS